MQVRYFRSLVDHFNPNFDDKHGVRSLHWKASASSRFAFHSHCTIFHFTFTFSPHRLWGEVPIRSRQLKRRICWSSTVSVVELSLHTPANEIFRLEISLFRNDRAYGSKLDNAAWITNQPLNRQKFYSKSTSFLPACCMEQFPNETTSSLGARIRCCYIKLIFLSIIWETLVSRFFSFNYPGCEGNVSQAWIFMQETVVWRAVLFMKS